MCKLRTVEEGLHILLPEVSLVPAAQGLHKLLQLLENKTLTDTAKCIPSFSHPSTDTDWNSDNNNPPVEHEILHPFSTLQNCPKPPTTFANIPLGLVTTSGTASIVKTQEKDGKVSLFSFGLRGRASSASY